MPMQLKIISNNISQISYNLHPHLLKILSKWTATAVIN